MATAFKSAPLPKHSLISSALSSEILNGKYQIGDLLPSEPELSLRFGVSRNTVRAALRSLQNIGLIISQQGVGSIVQQTKLVSHYSYGFSSAQDLLQYASTTSARIIDSVEIEVDDTLALVFGCKAGEHWWRIRTVRSEPSTNAVLAYSEIHIPLSFGAVLDEARQSGKPIFALIESRCGQTITEIQQDITCIPHIADDEATHLKLAPGSPAMQITRRYLGANGHTLETVRSVHPGATFKYSMRVELRHGA